MHFRFDDGSASAGVGIGFELKNFGLQSEHFEKFFNAFAGDSRAIDRDGLSAPSFRKKVDFSELAIDVFSIEVGFVAFVDRNDDGDIGSCELVQSLPWFEHGVLHRRQRRERRYQ